MTTLNSATKRAFFSPFKVALCAAVVAVGLAGCESGSNMLSNGNASGPQAAVAQPPQPSNVQSAKVQIAPVIGSPENVSRDLQAALASSIEKRKISVTTAPNGTGEYTLRGYVVAAREKTGSKISYIWDVTDTQGRRVNRVTGEEFGAAAGADPWSAVTPQIVQAIADKTAAQVAGFIPGSKPADTPVASAAPSMGASAAQNVASAAPGASQAIAGAATPRATPAALSTAAATPAATNAALSGPTTGSIETDGPVQTIVPTVIGAPGDGSTSLTSAIQRELGKNGVSLTSMPGAKTYKVEGKVAMGQAKDGKQPIQIEWNVIDPKGKKLGTVSQKNEVPQGSLDGTWGKTADAAAQAAASGIIKLLPGAKATN